MHALLIEERFPSDRKPNYKGLIAIGCGNQALAVTIALRQGYQNSKLKRRLSWRPVR